MPLPSAGWLATPTGEAPEQWLLPVAYEGTYEDPGPALGAITPNYTALIFGNAQISPQLGFVFIGVGADQALEVHLQQTGVFAVVLLDSVEVLFMEIEIPPDLFSPRNQFLALPPRYMRQ